MSVSPFVRITNLLCIKHQLNFMKFANQLQLVKYSSKKEPEMPVNKLDKFISATSQEKNGVVYDKKPFKIRLVPDKTYMWCLCGQSKNQPFCDSTHKVQPLKITLKPIMFQVEKEKEYWICNCKQTKHRPFCDGTHKTLE